MTIVQCLIMTTMLAITMALYDEGFAQKPAFAANQWLPDAREHGMPKFRDKAGKGE